MMLERAFRGPFFLYYSMNFIYQAYLDDPSICDGVINFHEQSKSRAPGMVMTERGRVIDKTLKDSVDTQLAGPLASVYFAQLDKIIKAYIAKYPQCNMYAPWGITQPANVQKYPPCGGYFSWHTERSNADPITSSRHLVFMTYLNDVTDGGETEFALQELKVQPRKGLTLIWPADWTHTHRGVPSPTQTKYVVTGWLCYL